MKSTQKARVLVYTLTGCPYCVAARFRLRRRGIDFEEIRGESSRDFRELLVRETGGRTAPQIVIDGDPIGGSDDLAALDRSGALLPRIRRESFPLVLTRGPFRPFRRSHEVRVIDRSGEIVERITAGSPDEARAAADSLRRRHREPG